MNVEYLVIAGLFLASLGVGLMAIRIAVMCGLAASSDSAAWICAAVSFVVMFVLCLWFRSFGISILQ